MNAFFAVAPHAGAWIETPTVSRSDHIFVVAPHAGAWIETLLITSLLLPPLVAPHAGAWIETSRNYMRLMKLLSLPTRERGLKLC